MDERQQPPASKQAKAELPVRVHLTILIVLQLIMGVELVLLFYERLWINAVVVMAIMAIMAITLSPAALGRRFSVNILPELQVLAVVFVFAALYLGEVQSYYERIWWWDIALHTSSGLLTGVFGTLWEIFEFSMDQLAGTIMQKPMFGDPSGLTDTMWDMIVNALGALVISTLGWWYMIRRECSFIESWIRKFIERNPRLFRS